MLAAIALVFAQALGFSAALEAASEHPEVREAEVAAAIHGGTPVARLAGQSSVLVQPGWRGRPQGDEGPELQIVVGHAFPLARQGRAIREAASADRAALAAETRAALLGRELVAADAWLDAWAASALARLLEEESTLLEVWEGRLARARELGAVLESELVQMRAERAELAARRGALARDLAEAERALAEALGRAERVAIEGEPPVWAALPQRPRTLDGFPGVQLARARREAEVADLRATLAGLAPQLFVGAQVQTEAPAGRMGYAVLQVQSANRAARSLELARGQTRHARAEVVEEATRREAERLFTRVHEEAQLADAHLAHHRVTVAPALQSLVEDARRRRERGESTLFEELEHRRRALAARERELELRIARDRAFARAHLLNDALGRAEGDER